MSTGGAYTVVADDHYYSCFVDADMYCDGHPSSLMREAVEIAERGEWAEVAEGWTSKAWISIGDEHLPRETTTQVPHPDGDILTSCDGQYWAYAMRPRRGRQGVLEKYGPERVDEWFEPLGDPNDRVFDDKMFLDDPSWRDAAQMPALLKEEFGDTSYKATELVVDMDHNQIVVITRWNTTIPGPSDGVHVPVAVADLSDPAAISDIAEWVQLSPWARSDGDMDERYIFHTSVGGPTVPDPDPPETFAKRCATALKGTPSCDDTWARAHLRTARHWLHARASLKDGQWLRPPGFPSLPGTPNRFPAQRFLPHSFDDERGPFRWNAEAIGSPNIPLSGPKCIHVGVRSRKRCMLSLGHRGDHHYPPDG